MILDATRHMLGDSNLKMLGRLAYIDTTPTLKFINNIDCEIGKMSLQKEGKARFVQKAIRKGNLVSNALAFRSNPR